MKLIKLKDKFILVSDEKHRSNDVVFINNEIYTNEIRIYTTAYGSDNLKDCIKVLAISFLKWTHNLPSINFSDLKEEDCKKIGWVDVERLALEAFKQGITFSNKEFSDTAYNRFRTWFSQTKTAQSLNDKQFSLEDMEKAFNFYAYASVSQQPYNEKENIDNFNTFIQSLQKTEWDVEVEMKEYAYEPIIRKFPKYRANPNPRLFKPKITNNSIKITKIL